MKEKLTANNKAIEKLVGEVSALRKEIAALQNAYNKVSELTVSETK
jgi:hypothetical protein